MSYIKKFIDDVMEMYEEGIPMMEIAETLKVPLDYVEVVVEQYSNFYD